METLETNIFSFKNILLYTYIQFYDTPTRTQKHIHYHELLSIKKNVKYSYFRNSNIVYLTPFKKK